MCIFLVARADAAKRGGVFDSTIFAFNSPRFRSGAHELLHLGAALRGQEDAVMHEVAVQLSSTPEVLLGGLGVAGGSVLYSAYNYTHGGW
jgi:hypothetical protein